MKILIVDDEKQFSDDLAYYIKTLGHEVYNTYTGEQALDILKNEKPDVIFCDLKLSGAGVLEGDDLLARIKDVSPKTIAVMLTAYASETTQKLIGDKGAFKCIYKPIRLDEVVSTLKELEAIAEKRNS